MYLKRIGIEFIVVGGVKVIWVFFLNIRLGMIRKGLGGLEFIF